MPTNDFLPFATDVAANVESQANYLTDTNRPLGNQPGIASSSFVNKTLRQAAFIASQMAQLVSTNTNTDVADNGVTAQFLAQLQAAVKSLPPKFTSYLSGSGSHNISYYFFIASGNATAGATYTNNAITFTVISTVASSSLVQMSGSGAPSVSGSLTKSGGTGDPTLTFYAVRAPITLEVEMVGGGGGGGAAAANNGAAGTASTFGTALLSAGGGGAGQATNGGSSAGGTSSLGTGPVGIAVTGSDGGCGQASGGTAIPSGNGGTGAFGGGRAANINAVGGTGTTNSGGGGAGGATSGACGGGGGAGGYIKALITTILSTYSYTVGAGGNGGAAGSQAGGNGAAGAIYLTERYQ